MRRPFAKGPLSLLLMQAEIVVGIGPVGKRLPPLGQLKRTIGGALRTPANRRLKRLQIRIVKKMCHVAPLIWEHYITNRLWPSAFS